MPKKGGKKTGGIKMRQTVKQKVIVNVNTGRSSRRPTSTRPATSTQRPVSSGSSAPVVILQPQPQIKPQQQQLQPQAQSQQVEELNRRLQSQQDQFSQQTKSLQDIIDEKTNKEIEAQIEADRKKAVLSQAQLERRDRERRIEKSAEASSSSSIKSSGRSPTRDESRDPIDRELSAMGIKKINIPFPPEEEPLKEQPRNENTPAPKKDHKKK